MAAGQLSRRGKNETTQDLPEEPQSEETAFQGDLGRPFNIDRRMVPREGEEPLKDPDAFETALLQKSRSPSLCVDPDPGGFVEHVRNTPFHDRDLLGRDMGGVRVERSLADAGMKGDLLVPVVRDADDPGVPLDPDLAAQILGWHRVIGAPDLHMTVPVHLSSPFLVQGKGLRRKRPQGRSLDHREDLAHMGPGGSMDPGVGNGAFPVRQMPVQRGNRRELLPLEGVVLDEVDPFFDLSLVAGHIGLGGKQNDPVVATERGELRVKIRVVPVGPENGGLQVVGDKGFGASPKGAEGIFQKADQGVGGLSPDRLAVGLPGMGQNDPQDVDLPSVGSFPEPVSRSKVDLGLGPGVDFHPSKRKGCFFFETANEAFDGTVGSGESLVGDQVLENPLGGETEVALGLDLGEEGFAGTFPTGDKRFPEGRNGWV